MYRALPTILALFVVGFVLGACKDHEHDHSDHDHAPGHSHAEKGTHGGSLLELGSSGHAEILHDETTGTIQVWLTGPDAKTALDSRTNPNVKFVLDQKPMVVPLESATMKLPSSEFKATHEAFKTHDLHFQLGVDVQDKHYDVEPHHDHDH